MSNDTFLDKVATLRSMLDSAGEMADPDLLAQLQDVAARLVSQYDEIMNSDRDLKLGIVGRVKAGKSSFLNALLFKGEDRLPKAATPMTAALTRITYADSPEHQEAVVHFYTKGDWNVIQSQAREFEEKIELLIDEAIAQKQKRQKLSAMSAAHHDAAADKGTPEERQEIRRLILGNLPKELERLKGCAELVEMANKNHITHSKLPRSGDKENEHRVELGQKAGNFLTGLNDFVGANGHYTPFVKYLQLKLHHPDLEGLEIVDTPGLNDPVASRVDVTNRFLTNCDAVMLLSGVSRFLDANDSDLAGRQFSEASVKRAYIIGTMIDIGLMEIPKRNISIEDAYAIACNAYEQRAEEFVRDLENAHSSLPKGMKREDGGNDGSWPIFVSSLFYGISRKMKAGETLNNEEQHVLNRLAALYHDYSEKLDTPDAFEDLSCFSEVRESVYVPVQNDKERILREKISSFRKDQVGLICGKLEDILISSERRKSQLEKNDRASLEKEKQTLLENLRNSRIEARNIFNEMMLNCKNGINDLKVNMRQKISSLPKIHIEREVKTSSHTTGIIFKDYHYETYTEKTAKVVEVTGNLERYGQDCMVMINSAFHDLFNPKRLEDKLRNAVTNTFKSINEDASQADIMGPIQGLLNSIAIPEVKFTAPDEAKKKVFDQFPSEVRDSAIGALEKAQSEQLIYIYDNYASQVDAALQEMVNHLSKRGSTFIDEVCGKVNDSYDQLERQLKDKEKNIELYSNFCMKISNLKIEFSQLEV